MKLISKIFSRSYSSIQEYDYIIVGAGSAGCVLANRLTENPDNQVLLCETGPKDKWWNWKIHMPAALMYNLSDDRYNWYYHTSPQKHMDDRVMYCPRGRVVGGSSALNAMAYVRGHAYDYDRWHANGAVGWSYADCLPYFIKAQTHDSLPIDEYTGKSGPLHVSRGSMVNPLHSAWLKAGQEAGYPYTPNMNGYQQEGVGPMCMTIHNGVRWSVSKAYLGQDVLSRKNLHILTNHLVSKVSFQGNKAVSVQALPFTRRNTLREHKSDSVNVFARKEIILCGGAINSPQLLMLSGIGPSRHLLSLGIECLHDLPGVGENLQDHLEVYVQQACSKNVSLYKAQWKFPHHMVRIGLQWFLTRKGLASSSHLETGGYILLSAHFLSSITCMKVFVSFVSSSNNVSHPDIQFHFLPGTVSDHGRVPGTQEAYQVHVGPMRPTRFIKLRSVNPLDHPIIDFQYLSTNNDVVEMRNCITISRKIFAQEAFNEFRGVEMQPGTSVQSDQEIDAFIRKFADSAYHPCGTCKMGQDHLAVVDSKGLVAGLENLRVVDASIMPSVPSGNLNAPTIMLAEKIADSIKGLLPLPPSTASVYSHTKQERDSKNNVFSHN